MAQIRIVYVPWPKLEAGELHKDAKEFKKGMSDRPSKKVNEWKLAYSDQPGQLVGLPADSQIYVLGHSDTGKDWITNKIEKLKYNLVCDRLIACGLSEHYAGRLKFYNCLNALDAEGAKGKNSFASKAAQCLRKKEFKNVRIFGYAGILCQPVAGLQKMYVPYRGTQAKFGARAVRVEYDETGLPMMVQPIVAKPVVTSEETSSPFEEYSAWEED